MTDSNDAIGMNRRAVGAFIDAARAVPPARWGTARAAGKWSPGQVTEHVVLAYEQSRKMLHGTFAGPAMPWYSQQLARRIGLPSMFKRGDFGKGPFQAPDFIQPGASPPPPDALLDRLAAVARDLEQNVPAGSDTRRVTVDHPIFGRLPLTDLLHFLSIHTNHHRPQLSPDAA